MMKMLGPRIVFAELMAAALALGTCGRASAVDMDCAAKDALVDNFSAWSGGRATTSVVEDDGRRFLRVESDATKGVVQYCGCRVDGTFPGFYRLRVKARNRGDGFEVLLRQDKQPYKRLACVTFSAPDWTEREYYVTAKEGTGPISVYLILGSGSYDLESISVDAVQREDLVRRYRRPPETVDELFFPTRFPLGLPQGWTIDKNAYRTTTEEREGNLVIRPNGDPRTSLYTSPFQTNRPDTNHWVDVVYRAKGNWRYELIDDRNKACGSATALTNADTFVRLRKLKWVPGLVSAITIRFSGEGEGELELKELHVIPQGRTVAAEKPTAALRFRGGAAGDATRVVFADETPAFDWKVVPARAGMRVRFSLTDVYGRTRTVGEEPVFETGGVVRGLDLPTLGAYRLQMDVLGADGGTQAATECVFCRVRRPVGWGRDLPDSPFGIHMTPREDQVRLAKACGVNWTRLHDAGTECTGWWALEAEKGKWTFHDDLVDAYRRNGIKILAQLGTSPSWASHYHDLGYKSMWYFARYLRPTNATDYVNYVTKTVSRYRGKIDEYFFWNEPWGGWWSTAADIKFFDKDRAAEDYAAFQKLTYDAVKSVDPSIRFVGLNSNAFDNGAKWSERVTAAGGLAACDVADYHIYTGGLRAKRTSDDTVRKAFGTVMERHPNLDGRSVYMTEGSGHNNGSFTGPEPVSGLYNVLVPWKPETPDDWSVRAARTVRFSLSMLAEGNERIFLYGTHCHTALGVTPSYAILVGADGGPTPESAAFSQFARMVEGKRFVTKEHYGERGMVFSFCEKTASRKVLRIYTDLTPAEARALVGRAACLDLYGNPTDGTRPTDESVLYELPSAAVTVDFAREVGTVKPVNGVGQPPLQGLDGTRMFRYLKDAGIPYSRLHDVGGAFGKNVFVDIPNLFRDFDADENDPANYDFFYTDLLLKALVAHGVEPYFRLGVTIENAAGRGGKAYRIFPPKDYAKWARICEHVIRHYTEGWADGFRMKISHWEIWNEPDSFETVEKSMMWKAPFSEYIRLYLTAAKHLKAKFPHLKIGGYASCGFYAVSSAWAKPEKDARYPYLMKCFTDFLSAVRDEKAPLDFFSFHCYDRPDFAEKQIAYCRKTLDDYGFTATEMSLNEWLPCDGGGRMSDLGTPRQTAEIAAMLCLMQNGPVDDAEIYDARCSSSSYAPIFHALTLKPYPAYCVYVAFNELRRLGRAVRTESPLPGVWATAAKSADGRGAALIVNASEDAVSLGLDARGWRMVSCMRVGSGLEEVERPSTLPGHSVFLLRFKEM